MTYLEKLKDPRWQKKRLEIFNRDEFACRACGDTGSTLNVHHIFYLSNREPWDIPDGLLITLCENCHKTGSCTPEYKSCDDCPDYRKDCLGNVDSPNEIINEIGLFLDFLWESNKLQSCVDVLYFLRQRMINNG